MSLQNPQESFSSSSELPLHRQESQFSDQLCQMEGISPRDATDSLDECDNIWRFFEKNGTLVYRENGKVIVRYGPYSFKGIFLFDQEESNLKWKKNIECLQNEFQVSQLMKKEDKQIVRPHELCVSPNRCVLLSPFMSERDAWVHLIDKRQQLFGHIQLDSFILKNNKSQEQINLLRQARFLLFGAMKLLSQIGGALEYLHEELNMAHNDLKPDNFFAHFGPHPLIPSTKERDYINMSEDDDGVSYYLSDFGYTKKCGFASNREGINFFLQKKLTYLAPEILAWFSGGSVDLENLEKQADVFALGVSVFQVLFHVNPFFQKGCFLIDPHYLLLSSDPEMFWLIVQKQLEIYKNMTNIVLLKDFLSKMLEQNPINRITITQVLSHPWLLDIQQYLLNNTD